MSPVTIVLPTLAMEVKQELGKKISDDAILAEMIEQFKTAENREPSEAELKEIRSFIENR